VRSIAYMLIALCYRRPYVCQTGGSYKNGRSYDHV